MKPWWIHKSRVKVLDSNVEPPKDPTKGSPVKEDFLTEPAPWWQEHSSKELGTSTDPFGKADTRKKLVEKIMLSGPASNQSLSG